MENQILILKGTSSSCHLVMETLAAALYYLVGLIVLSDYSMHLRV